MNSTLYALCVPAIVFLGCSAAKTRETSTADSLARSKGHASESAQLIVWIAGGVDSARLVDPLGRVGVDPDVSTSTIPEFQYYTDERAAIDDSVFSESLILEVPAAPAGEYTLEIARSSDPVSGVSLSCQAFVGAGVCSDSRILSAAAGTAASVRFHLVTPLEGECSLDFVDSP